MVKMAKALHLMLKISVSGLSSRVLALLRCKLSALIAISIKLIYIHSILIYISTALIYISRALIQLCLILIQLCMAHIHALTIKTNKRPALVQELTLLNHTLTL